MPVKVFLKANKDKDNLHLQAVTGREARAILCAVQICAERFSCRKSVQICAEKKRQVLYLSLHLFRRADRSASLVLQLARLA